jgi:hypothetical protein
MEHDRQLAGPRLEALLQPGARVLELGEHPDDVIGVAFVVARHERV